MGSTFDGWGSGCPGSVSGTTCQLTLSSNATISASFTSTQAQGGGGGGSGSGGGSGGGGSSGGSGSGAGRAPKTTILADRINQRSGIVTFRFRAAGSHSGFQCALVHHGLKARHAAPHYAACRSPRTYRDLRGGTYGFYVRALARGDSPGTASKRAFAIR